MLYHIAAVWLLAIMAVLALLLQRPAVETSSEVKRDTTASQVSQRKHGDRLVSAGTSRPARIL